MIVYREAPTLARDLGVGLHTLYALSNRLCAHYHTVELTKPNGGVRRLTVPDEALKGVQRSIARNLLACRELSPYATAYRYGVGTVRNASAHVGKARLLKMDIYHFFDSVNYSAVKDAVFPAEVFSEPLRILLTMLCYYQDALPQGAPTSPAVANILMRDFDENVGGWCARRGIAYTRYCDDLTFSGDVGLAGAYRYAEARLREKGFLVNRRKTLYLDAGRRQCVTGLVVNEKVDVPAEYRRALRQELYYCKKFGLEEHLRSVGWEGDPTAYARRLLGRFSYALQVRPEDRALLEGKAWLVEELNRRAGK
ncbi:reverse transcriptase family protein [Pseudoflavonifractor phocaeensis]|uniref:reverse transcriptase family protein n=1 Tax=Pseudoflavonifractor phocaeensis TaxID=1870988 RepID=UPI00210CAFDF|nr:reverse transcriptase family protein [Pseudoflavonifractor phocaeensis]MCQ4865746.1 reverse transcriptase family protein [Pseudoflavonifractor phocaeensis]